MNICFHKFAINSLFPLLLVIASPSIVAAGEDQSQASDRKSVV